MAKDCLLMHSPQNIGLLELLALKFQLFREFRCADFPQRSQKCSVVSGMELRGFPETKSKMFSCFGNGAARISRNEVKNVQLFREWSCADFPKRSQKCSVVSGMELRGFPETKSKMFSCFGNGAARISRNEVKNVQLFREWSCADFPKRSQKCSVVSGISLRGFPETTNCYFF